MTRVRRGIRRRLLAWTRNARRLRPRQYANLLDYHIHTSMCGHAFGEPAEYVRRAVELGLPEIGFADHMPLLRIRDEHLTMEPEELPDYVKLITDLRDSRNDITIRLGIEMDYIPGQMDEIWQAASGIEFDYVYGAVHYIDGWDFGDSRHLSSYHGRDPDEAYERYFELFCEAAREGGFDILAHPDLVKKHGIMTRLPLRDMYEEAARCLSEVGVAIEINTSGLRKRALETYPALPFLRACAERGVPVTLGSDAHAPDQVGMDFDIALRLLERAGVCEIAAFERRRRTLRPLLPS
ncbi:MAG: histidinol-phosphatase HisJ family protein [Candidatus Eisenbacteria bacterium]|nr:histidinol-phosphatase HisJ family protein [Candidatus Eisenbacteria bacterium]